MTHNLARLAATFFYVGYLPLAPGSMASVLGMFIAVALYGQTMLYIVVASVITIIGFLASGKLEKTLGKKDPSCIVIDEVAGVMIAFFMLPLTPAVLWITFFLFRAFDMFKIYPAGKFEKLPGSIGIMADDIVAGLYANIIMHLALLSVGTPLLFK